MSTGKKDWLGLNAAAKRATTVNRNRPPCHPSFFKSKRQITDMTLKYIPTT